MCADASCVEPAVVTLTPRERSRSKEMIVALHVEPLQAPGNTSKPSGTRDREIRTNRHGPESRETSTRLGCDSGPLSGSGTP